MAKISIISPGKSLVATGKFEDRTRKCSVLNNTSKPVLVSKRRQSGLKKIKKSKTTKRSPKGLEKQKSNLIQTTLKFIPVDETQDEKTLREMLDDERRRGERIRKQLSRCVKYAKKMARVMHLDDGQLEDILNDLL